MNFSEFIDLIGDYESDTFSAFEEKVTNVEKIKIANEILDIFVDNYLDGVLLKQILEEIRG